jgi:hypothetical protein
MATMVFLAICGLLVLQKKKRGGEREGGRREKIKRNKMLMTTKDPLLLVVFNKKINVYRGYSISNSNNFFHTLK